MRIIKIALHKSNTLLILLLLFFDEYVQLNIFLAFPYVTSSSFASNSLSFLDKHLQ